MLFPIKNNKLSENFLWNIQWQVSLMNNVGEVALLVAKIIIIAIIIPLLYKNTYFLLSHSEVGEDI